MPYHDEEYPGQSLCQSVVLFCCKGMIEVIMVLLFFWLLIQVLFTKQLEVHLQVLLIVGLVVFCLCLILGCVLCMRMSEVWPHQDKELVTAVLVEPVAFPTATAAVREQYEDLDVDVQEFPSTFSSPTASNDNFISTPYSPRSPASEIKEHPKSYSPLRRLSTPCLSSPVYRPRTQGRASFGSLPRLGMLSRTRRALERRCSATGHHARDGSPYSERSRLTSTCSSSVPEGPIPLATLHYGSSYRQPGPSLDFSMAFSPEHGTLTVSVLGITRASHRLEEVSVLGSLAPMCPCPVQAAVRPSLSREPYALGLVLNVGCVEELQRCVLRLAVYTRHPPSVRGSPLGELEVQCGGKDWHPDRPLHVTKELSPNKWKLKKSLTSQDASTGRGGSSTPQPLGQLFILLQYQTLGHRIKAMVLRADNLVKLTHGSLSPDYQVVVNLRQEGVVISTRETKGVGGANTVWNSPFLFELPPGDVNQLPLQLEFIVTQNQAHSKSTVLGRVLIGPEASEGGRSHWRDMCSQGQVERARWHTVQPEVTDSGSQSGPSTLSLKPTGI
ncbi:uncharacterized protein [Osmerus mordax]|uniref:uncharacterized protein n=1 Tax=Osmerus mordax TaxID=8014 RepID=UPI00350EF5A9